MKQTRLGSLIEACANTLAGLLFSFGIQKVLNHAYDVEMSDATALWFVVWFTIASVLRSYIIRRLWANQWWNTLLAMVRLGPRKPKPSASTKICPGCGCMDLICLSSQHRKICAECNLEIAWNLDKGQASLLNKRRVSPHNNRKHC